MKPPPFEYAAVRSLDEALGALGAHGDEAKPLAGGQSLVPLLNMRLASPAVLVDLNRVPGLDGITPENGTVRVGALVRQAVFEGSHAVARLLPLAAECLPFVGHFVTRNRGTVGGSIAHADAKGELPLALLTLGGSAVAAGPTGRRTIPAEQLFLTHFTTALAPEELLVETIWPAASPGSGSAFEEFALRAGDYALAMAACMLRVESGRVVEGQVGIAGPADRPILSSAGPLLVGEPVTAEVARAAGETARKEVEPADAIHASAAYQRHLVGLLVERAVTRAWRNALEGVEG